MVYDRDTDLELIWVPWLVAAHIDLVVFALVSICLGPQSLCAKENITPINVTMASDLAV